MTGNNENFKDRPIPKRPLFHVALLMVIFYLSFRAPSRGIVSFFTSFIERLKGHFLSDNASNRRGKKRLMDI
jgi:hypothetical protein